MSNVESPSFSPVFDKGISNGCEIKVHGHASWECKQSRRGHLPKLPARGIFLAPSQQFKTTAMVDLILRHYRGCFERLYIFSSSVDIDSSWGKVKEYVSVHLGVRDNEKCFFHEFDHDALEKIVADQHNK